MRKSLFLFLHVFIKAKTRLTLYKSILTVQYENKLPDSFIVPTPYPFLGW